MCHSGWKYLPKAWQHLGPTSSSVESVNVRPRNPVWSGLLLLFSFGIALLLKKIKSALQMDMKDNSEENSAYDRTKT